MMVGQTFLITKYRSISTEHRKEIFPAIERRIVTLEQGKVNCSFIKYCTTRVQNSSEVILIDTFILLSVPF